MWGCRGGNQSSAGGGRGRAVDDDGHRFLEFDALGCRDKDPPEETLAERTRHLASGPRCPLRAALAVGRKGRLRENCSCFPLNTDTDRAEVRTESEGY